MQKSLKSLEALAFPDDELAHLDALLAEAPRQCDILFIIEVK